MAGMDYTCSDSGAKVVSCSVAGCNGKHKAKGLCQKHYRQSQRKGIDQYNRRISCAHCGIEFEASNSKSMYCSNKCKQAAWKALNAERLDAYKVERQESRPKYSPVAFNKCNTCNKLFVSKRKKSYCSDACLPQRVNAAKMIESLSSAPCATCGKPVGYTFGRGKVYCSKSCRKQSETYKETKRAAKAKRRAIERGSSVETVKPFSVFERDKWRCQLCGVRTPKNLRNTIKDNAPELDHIIPLSKGGDHSYRNTQCACRKCNIEKSNRPLGQMLLIG